MAAFDVDGAAAEIREELRARGGDGLASACAAVAQAYAATLAAFLGAVQTCADNPHDMRLVKAVEEAARTYHAAGEGLRVTAERYVVQHAQALGNA